MSGNIVMLNLWINEPDGPPNTAGNADWGCPRVELIQRYFYF
ncbi:MULTISPECIES: hypothetical protein [Paenibacillus]|nr:MULTISPECIES: hypothetical protein [Paenibacillus]